MRGFYVLKPPKCEADTKKCFGVTVNSGVQTRYFWNNKPNVYHWDTAATQILDFKYH